MFSFNPKMLQTSFHLSTMFLLVCWLNMDVKAELVIPPEKVNLALRRTADALLRLSGDTTSQIPAIEQTESVKWRVHLEQAFSYDSLPYLLQQSLDLYGIKEQYNVTVRRCDDGTIDLGYQQLDIWSKNGVPCQGRNMPVGCHYIEVSFNVTSASAPSTNYILLSAILGCSGLLGFWYFQRIRKESFRQDVMPPNTDWIEIGNSKLDTTGQTLLCEGVKQTLTFREAKLLHLFATHPDQLLQRDFIIQRVWADEGILVGRSVDVFVSRLRKKLAGDSSLNIAVVHGIGYRMETSRL